MVGRVWSEGLLTCGALVHVRVGESTRSDASVRVSHVANMYTQYDS